MGDDTKDPFKAAQQEMAKALRGMSVNAAGIAGRSIAGDLFMQPKINLPTMPERFDFASASQVISAIANELNEMKVNPPQGKVLDLTMATPDGRVMGVELIKPIGFSTYLAKGHINELPCTIMAHISTLNLFCAYIEEARGRSRPGFVIEVLEPIEPQLEPAQKGSGTKKPARGSAKK